MRSSRARCSCSPPRAGHAEGWQVQIEKRAPVGAGSAAAAPTPAPPCGSRTRRCRSRSRRGDLLALAAEVGSDVPFFASGRSAALARGRGELLEPCRSAAPAWVVLAWPGVELSTAEVYAQYRPSEGAGERVAELSAAPFAAPDGGGSGGPRRERPRSRRRGALPGERRPARTAAGLGALTACVSGSGSAVFGLFADEDAARAAHELLAGEQPWLAVARLPEGDAGARIKRELPGRSEDVVVVDREGRRVPPQRPRGFHGEAAPAPRDARRRARRTRDPGRAGLGREHVHARALRPARAGRVLLRRPPLPQGALREGAWIVAFAQACSRSSSSRFR